MAKTKLKSEFVIELVDCPWCGVRATYRCGYRSNAYGGRPWVYTYWPHEARYAAYDAATIGTKPPKARPAVRKLEEQRLRKWLAAHADLFDAIRPAAGPESPGVGTDA